MIDIEGRIGENLMIYHPNIIISPKAIVGNNVKLHGSNCIGNNGLVDKAPKIGNNVDIGYGATIIGNIEIADDIIIGANALVNKSFLWSHLMPTSHPLNYTISEIFFRYKF